jgi:CheY-like chemotaxis protein
MKIIKQNPDYQAIKIFAVTGYAMPGDRERFLAAGFDGYFSKPIEKEAILEGIRNAINPDTAQAAA